MTTTLNLLKEKWDIAIILDACRFDSFSRYCERYLGEGRLERRLGASHTLAWLRTVFARRHEDIVYVSGNPFVNSLGALKHHFYARDRFRKVFDVWDFGWDDEVGTTSPQEVTRKALEARDEYPDMRMIVHYMQPHHPYRKAPLGFRSDLNLPGGHDGGAGRGFRSSLEHLVLKCFGRVQAWRTGTWYLRRLARLEPSCMDEYLWRSFRVEQLKSMYEDNLEWVLGEVKALLRRLDGVVIVTSDHGEAFGERGEFFHHEGMTNPFVRCVPFWTKD